MGEGGHQKFALYIFDIHNCHNSISAFGQVPRNKYIQYSFLIRVLGTNDSSNIQLKPEVIPIKTDIIPQSYQFHSDNIPIPISRRFHSYTDIRISGILIPILIKNTIFLLVLISESVEHYNLLNC